MKKTKIICTIGPASSSQAIMEQLIESGMNVARLNFSHGSNTEHLKTIKLLKEIREKSGKDIGILQDLAGPKIRVGNIPEQGLVLKKDQMVTLFPGTEYKDGLNIPINYVNLLKEDLENSKILVDDGLLEIYIKEKSQKAFLGQIVRGGILKSHKGINFPNINLSQSAPTAKDLEDLEFGIKHDVDFIALSFVQEASDIQLLKEKIRKAKSNIMVIAKLERGVALKNLDQILQVADGVMVARGDLGIETDIAMIPIYQKMIIRKSNLIGKPVITATQMLDSMIRNPLPTRAETTDVANAIYDGTDAIMLSGETAIGKNPVKAVRIMRKIADNVEVNLGLDRGWIRESKKEISFTNQLAVAHSVCESAEELNARWIIAHTMSGQTARYISMYRPKTQILAITPLKHTYYQLSLNWGIKTVLLPEIRYQLLDIISNAEKVLIAKSLVKKGDLVVISAGLPTAKAGATNIMKIHIIGDKPQS